MKNENGVSSIIGALMLCTIITTFMGTFLLIQSQANTTYIDTSTANINMMKRFTDYLNSLGFGNKTIYKNETLYKNTTIYVNQTIIEKIYPESPKIELQLNKTTGVWHFFVYNEKKNAVVEYVEQWLYPP